MRMLTVVLLVVFGAADTAAQRREMRFASMDVNDDGVITRQEWRGNDRSFERNDWNGDGILSGDELRPGARRAQPRSASDPGEPVDREYEFTDWTERGFKDLDHDDDAQITREEWHFDLETFRRADRDRNGRLSRHEFLGGAPAALDTGSEAFRQGHQRGVIEGRRAGKEDRAAGWGWDLDGQRELETADSGYQERYGPRSEYQAGYREGFTRGYGEGFGPRE